MEEKKPKNKDLILREISITTNYIGQSIHFSCLLRTSMYFWLRVWVWNLLKVENSLLIEIVLFITSSVFLFLDFQLFQAQKIHIAKQKKHIGDYQLNITNYISITLLFPHSSSYRVLSL
jgi:putative membrane protein